MDKKFILSKRDFDQKSSSDMPEWLKNYPEYFIQVKKLREKNGITQAQLAESIGMTWRSIPNIESGRVNPKLSTLEKIAESLDSELYILLIPKMNFVSMKNTYPKEKPMLNPEILTKEEIDADYSSEDIFFFD